MKKIIADCHIHSEHSFDSTEKTDNICLTAMEKGCSVIAITDHFETGEYQEPDQCDISEIKKASDEAAALNERFNRLTVLRGMELGQPCHDIAHAESALSCCKHDFVLASIHLLADKRDFYFLDYTKTDPVEIYRLYLDEIIETIEYGKFDALAHFTYPRRYMARDKRLPDISLFKKKTDDALYLLASKNKALELNSYAKYIDHKLMREYYDIIRRFRELGGRMITFGSDAHQAGFISGGLDFMRELAVEAGYQTGVYFVNHRPEEYEL